MSISNKYIVLDKVTEEKKEGFHEVKVQDSSTFKGKVVLLPEIPVFLGNRQVGIGDIVLYAKNSPDTHLVDNSKGKSYKYVAVADVLGFSDALDNLE